jgi:hypothetical protein
MLEQMSKIRSGLSHKLTNIRNHMNKKRTHDTTQTGPLVVTVSSGDAPPRIISNILPCSRLKNEDASPSAFLFKKQHEQPSFGISSGFASVLTCFRAKQAGNLCQTSQKC